MLGQHRQFTCNARQLTIPRRVERKPDFAFARLLALDDVLVVRAVHRAVLLQRVEREDDVIGRYGLAVMPARRRVQPVNDPGKIVGIGGGLGELPVSGRWFVFRTGCQRFNNHGRAAGKRSLEAADDDIEVVEGALFEHAHHAALRRIRIDVVVALEVRGVFDVAKYRQCMSPDRPFGRGLRVGRCDRGNDRIKSQCRGHCGGRAALQKMSSGNRQMRVPVACDLCPETVLLQPPLLKGQYKAGIRPITLLFPHLGSPGTLLLRRNVPITRMRSQIGKRPGIAWPLKSPIKTTQNLFPLFGVGL